MAPKIVCVVGPTACGKTTLGKTLLHLLPPTSGEVWFEGKELSGLSRAELRAMRTRMQIVFQDPYASLNPRMIIGDALMEPMLAHNLCNRQAAEEQAMKLLTAVTRQAAAEMTERLTAQLGKKAVRGLTVGTFHAISMNLLDPKPIVSRPQAQEIIATLLEEHEENLSPAECLRLLSLYKNQFCIRASETSALPAWLPGAYEQRLEMLGLRDLDDLLLHALQTPVGSRKQFHHLLVDEFQDINAVQHALVSHWSQKSRSLFVIGDPDQAIYGFRGAQADCFDTFLAAHPDTQLIRLSQNYRSTPQVVEAALSTIRQNPGTERHLHAHQPDGLPIRLMEAPDAFSESVWIAKEIARMAGGVDMLDAQHDHSERTVSRSFSEIAILCRTHRQLEQIENALS